MNKIISLLSLILFILVQSISAQETVSMASSASLVRIEYQSIDEFNRPVTLSATISLPDSGKTVTTVILSNTSFNRLSNVFASMEKFGSNLWTSVTNKGVAIVEPQNYVAADSSLRSIPKFTYDLAGRQDIDALSAAISYLKGEGLVKNKKYTSYIIGYGLGANMAQAAQRSLETDYTKAQQEEIRMGATYCANASVAPSEMWHDALAGADSYSALNTMVMLDNVLKTYAEGCMKSFTDIDVFSEEFLNSHILDFIYSDNFSERQINQMFVTTFGSENPSLDKLISSSLMEENSAVRRAVDKALAQNTLPGSWNPQFPIYTFQEGATQYFDGVWTELVQNVKSKLATAEMQFLTNVYTKLCGIELPEIPILLFYNSSVIAGTFSLKTNINANFKLSMYSSLLEKTADINVTLSPDLMSVMTKKIPATIDMSYYQRGLIDITVSVNNIIPFVQNFSYLLGDGTFQSQGEADSVATVLNRSYSSFRIGINEVPNWFLGSFATAEGSESGTYKIDILFKRNKKSISFDMIKKCLF